MAKIRSAGILFWLQSGGGARLPQFATSGLYGAGNCNSEQATYPLGLKYIQIKLLLQMLRFSNKSQLITWFAIRLVPATNKM